MPKKKVSDNKKPEVKKSPKKSKVIKKNVKRKVQQKTYTFESLQKAIQEINDGTPLRQVSKTFGIPKSTLSTKRYNEVLLECKKGPPTVLNADEEDDFKKWVIYSTERGFYVTRDCLLDWVQKFLNAQKRETIFTNNRPGRSWFKSFEARHSNLSSYITRDQTFTRPVVSEKRLLNWFNTIKINLEDKGLLQVDPKRIFIFDKTSFLLHPSLNKITTASEKACQTVLFTANASGELLPPMILFDVKSAPRSNILDCIPTDWAVGNSDSGSMTSESFYKYIKTVFFKHLKEKSCEFPVILYANVDPSHLSLPLVKFCTENQIELIKLFPNASHITQPMDVSLFEVLMEVYKNVNRQWRIDNGIAEFKRSMFAPVLKIALDSTDFSESLKNVFKTSGLCPFNPSAYDLKALKKKKKPEENKITITHTNNIPSTKISKNPPSTKILKNPSSTKISKNTSPTKISKNTSPTKISKNTSPTKISKNTELLQVFEGTLLSPEILQNFRLFYSSGQWNGDITQLELYNSWKKLKEISDNEEAAVTDSNNSLTTNSNATTIDLQQQNCSNSSAIVNYYSKHHCCDTSNHHALNQQVIAENSGVKVYRLENSEGIYLRENYFEKENAVLDGVTICQNIEIVNNDQHTAIIDMPELSFCP